MDATTTGILSAQIASSTAFSGVITGVLFAGAFSLLYTILPFAIGMLVFFIGYGWARRALGGR